jgi:hypothetical protein
MASYLKYICFAYNYAYLRIYIPIIGIPNSHTDGTYPHWMRVEPNQTRTHVLKSYPPPAPAPVLGYTFFPIPTPSRVKNPTGNTHPETTQQDNIISPTYK